MDDHRVDTAQRRGQLGHRERVDERRAGRTSPGELDGEHSAADGELARGERVLPVARQGRVVDAHDAVLTRQPRGQCRGRRRVTLHPHRQRGDAAQDEEGGERRE